MSLKSNAPWLLLGAALVASLWASEARAAKGTFEQTLSVDETMLLDVSTGSGSITVEAGPAGTVEIIGHITVRKTWFGRSDEDATAMVEQLKANPPIEVIDGEIRVGYLKEGAFKRNVSISYEILVPADTRVKSRTGSGSQTIAGVAEILKASSGSGSVNIRDIDGPTAAKTGSGRITLTNVDGATSANTGSGSVRAENIGGAFDGDTGSGGIYLAQSAPGDVKVSTGSGSIELHSIDGALHARAGSGRIRVDGRQNGTWDLDTGSGSIAIDLPDDAAFQLDAESSSGGIVVDHPVTVQGKISKRHLRGEVRGGGDLLKIDTGSGGIRIN